VLGPARHDAPDEGQRTRDHAATHGDSSHAGHLSIMTSVDLTTTRTASPGFRAIASTDPRVIAETNSKLSTCTTTSAMTLPSFTDLTVPANWLRALSMVASRVGQRMLPATYCSNMATPWSLAPQLLAVSRSLWLLRV